MALNVIGVPASASDSADAVWAFISPALEYGSMDTDDALKNAVRQGSMQLWAVYRATALVGAMVTEVTHRPRGRVCCVVAASGEDISASGCVEAIEQITPWARSLGCEQFEINGRPGWGRHLKGWTLAHTTHRRAII
jgi:hypothetical protein